MYSYQEDHIRLFLKFSVLGIIKICTPAEIDAKHGYRSTRNFIAEAASDYSFVMRVYAFCPLSKIRIFWSTRMKGIIKTSLCACVSKYVFKNSQHQHCHTRTRFHIHPERLAVLQCLFRRDVQVCVWGPFSRSKYV